MSSLWSYHKNIIPFIYKKSSYLSQAAAYRLITNYYFHLTKS